MPLCYKRIPVRKVLFVLLVVGQHFRRQMDGKPAADISKFGLDGIKPYILARFRLNLRFNLEKILLPSQLGQRHLCKRCRVAVVITRVFVVRFLDLLQIGYVPRIFRITGSCNRTLIAVQDPTDRSATWHCWISGQQALYIARKGTVLCTTAYSRQDNDEDRKMAFSHCVTFSLRQREYRVCG